MIKRPVLKPHLDLEIVHGIGVYIIKKNKAIKIKGWLYELVLPMLDGGLTEDIEKRLYGFVTKPEILYVINNLEINGYLMEFDDKVGSPEEAFYSELTKPERPCVFKKFNKNISFYNISKIVTEKLEKQIIQSGLCLSDSINSLEVVFCDDFLDEKLQAINQKYLILKRLWLPIKVTGSDVYIGPIINLTNFFCWECVINQIKRNNRLLTIESDAYKLNTRGWSNSSGFSTESIGIICNFLKLFLTDLSLGTRIYDENFKSLTSINFTELTIKKHYLYSDSSCQVCNFYEKRPTEVVLKNTVKTDNEILNHRKFINEEINTLLKKFIDPFTGIVPYLEEITNQEDLVYVYSTNLWKNRHFPATNFESVLRFGVGYGFNIEAAKCGAMCEAIGHYCGSFIKDEKLLYAKYGEFEKMIHPNIVMQFSSIQYENRNEFNKIHSLKNYVPQLFTTGNKIFWAPVFSLTENSVKYLPAALVYENCGAVSRSEFGLDFLVSDSNGRACGGSLEEAIFYGLLELIERDSVGIWWYNKIPAKKVNFETIPNENIKKIKAHYQSIGREVCILDVTSNLGINVFVAVSYKLITLDKIIFGFGCHLDPESAILSCLSELAQSIKPISDYEDLQSNSWNSDVQYWWQKGSILDRQFESVLSHEMIDFSCYTSKSTTRWKDDIEILISSIENQGIEILVSNQSRQEYGLSVVKIFAPGLAHFRPRFLCPRLYQLQEKYHLPETLLIEETLNDFHLPV